jgi:PAS domain S-box-containing protein
MSNTDLVLYKNLFEFSPTPTALFTPDGRCQLANRSFCVQLGYNPTQFEKEIRLSNILTPKISRELVKTIQNRGVIRRQEITLTTKEGDQFTALLAGRTLANQAEASIEISFMNIVNQKELQHTFKHEHIRMASLIENLAAGVFLIDKDGLITEANMALGNSLGTEATKLIGKPYLQLFSHMLSLTDEPELLQVELSRAVVNISENPVIVFAIPVKTRLEVELTLFPVRDEAGNPIGWGGLLQDTTELKAQAEWKLELLSILSHDIRSPLATLKGHSTALLSNHTQWSRSMTTEFLEAIDRGVEQLSRQVDRNLALTRVETGRLGLRPEAIEGKEIVQQALERMGGILKNRTLNLEIPAGLPKTRVDPNRIEEVLINIIENAIRFSPAEQPITVALADKVDWIEFAITDFGTGIPAELQNDIFGKHYQGEPDQGGIGLGLYISKKIIEAHGGKIWVESPLQDKSSGTTFFFTTPKLPEISGINLPVPSLNSPASIYVDEAQFRILVVEDEADYQALLHAALNEEGYQVEIVDTGQAALDILQIHPPDMVLLDWILPDTNGLQICRNIRRWSNVPIIMLTSRTAQEDVIAAFDVGADDYITKPYQSEELLARIRALLWRNESTPLKTDQQLLGLGEVLIDVKSRNVQVSGKKVFLTSLEFDLFTYLARHANQILTYNQLNDTLWPDGQGTRHRLSVLISRLRKKVEKNPEHPTKIITEWGVGYTFRP